LKKNTVILTVSGVALVLGLVLGILPIGENLNFISIGLTLVTLFACYYLMAPEVAEGVRERRANISILLYIASLGACLLGEFIEAGAVIFLYCLGEQIEHLAITKNRQSIERLLDLSPPLVRLMLDDGSTQDVDPEDVPLFSTIVVRPGERLALDAIVSAGSAEVDESTMTGESLAQSKSIGDMLFAGSLCLNGRLECSTIATVSNSSLARIVRYVESAQKRKSPYERFIDRFTRYYTPAVIILSVLAAIVPPLLNRFTELTLGGFSVWFYRALSMLVVSCPCALAIAAPIAIVSGITLASSRGILVKGGSYIEQAAKLKVLALDKTGTLTEGQPQLDQIIIMPTAARLWPNNAESQILALAALLEKDSNHPLARAIQIAAAQQPVAKLAIENWTELAGQGVSATVAGRPALIGSRAFVSSRAQPSRVANRTVEQVSGQGVTTLFLAYDDQILAVFALRDTVRASSVDLLDRLDAALSHQVKTVMLTGDDVTVAEQIASEIGIEEVYANLMPEEKQQYIEDFGKKHGIIAYVGDGINDAPALAAADIGIAMGAAGSDIALDVSDIALMTDNISILPWFFALAKRVMRTVKTSVILTVLVKVCVLILAAFGLVDMWVAIAADVGMLILVLLYGMRIGIT